MLNHLSNDFKKAILNGPEIISKSMSDIIVGTTSVLKIFELKLFDVLSVSITYQYLSKNFINLINKETWSYNDDIRKANSLINDLTKDNYNNIKLITEKDGNKFNQLQIDEANNLKHELEYQQNFWKTINSMVYNIDRHFSLFIPLIMSAYKLAYDQENDNLDLNIGKLLQMQFLMQMIF